eukprot:80521-Pelagomonas_calceolata.AAC.1
MVATEVAVLLLGGLKLIGKEKELCTSQEATCIKGLSLNLKLPTSNVMVQVWYQLREIAGVSTVGVRKKP